MPATEQVSSERTYPTAASTDDINYFLGWLCWVPPVAIIAAIVFLVLGSRRRAFQAIVVMLVYLPAIVIVQLLAAGSGIPGLTGIMSVLMVIAVPLLTTAAARSSEWPRRSLKPAAANDADGAPATESEACSVCGGRELPPGTAGSNMSVVEVCHGCRKPICRNCQKTVNEGDRWWHQCPLCGAAVK
jgi:hypothetical protein